MTPYDLLKVALHLDGSRKKRQHNQSEEEKSKFPLAKKNFKRAI